MGHCTARRERRRFKAKIGGMTPSEAPLQRNPLTRTRCTSAGRPWARLEKEAGHRIDRGRQGKVPHELLGFSLEHSEGLLDGRHAAACGPARTPPCRGSWRRGRLRHGLPSTDVRGERPGHQQPRIYGRMPESGKRPNARTSSQAKLAHIRRCAPTGQPIVAIATLPPMKAWRPCRAETEVSDFWPCEPAGPRRHPTMRWSSLLRPGTARFCVTATVASTRGDPGTLRHGFG